MNNFFSFLDFFIFFFIFEKKIYWQWNYETCKIQTKNIDLLASKKPESHKLNSLHGWSLIIECIGSFISFLLFLFHRFSFWRIVQLLNCTIVNDTIVYASLAWYVLFVSKTDFPIFFFSISVRFVEKVDSSTITAFISATGVFFSLFLLELKPIFIYQNVWTFERLSRLSRLSHFSKKSIVEPIWTRKMKKTYANQSEWSFTM